MALNPTACADVQHFHLGKWDLPGEIQGGWQLTLSILDGHCRRRMPGELQKQKGVWFFGKILLTTIKMI